MKPLRPCDHAGLDRLSPVVWTSTGDEAHFEFLVEPARGAFLCFFLRTASGPVAPRLGFDEGDGFSEITLALKSFPFAFYHVSLAQKRDLRRLRFRPCDAPATFRFLAFQTANSILVAVLHFLFNLRYQNIGLVAADSKGRPGRLQAIKSNIERVVKFFGDVSKGRGATVQEGSQEMVPILQWTMSMKAIDVERRMNEHFAQIDNPLISFVAPTYNTRPDYLRDLLKSFTVQAAAYAELVLSDDGSTNATTIDSLEQARETPGVSVVRNAVNRGIAATTNAGIAAARGRWIAFVDHDDAFVPGAIAIIADAIEKNPDALFFYTDEIVADGALKPMGAQCKPAYDSVLLSGANYINHFSVFRADRLAAIDNLREDREGSQDYDLLLRYLTGAPLGSIVHIPFPAYIWRRETQTYSVTYLDRAVASARLALTAAYAAEGHKITVEDALIPMLHRVRFKDSPSRPMVSIIIPNRNSLALITRIIADLLDRTAYAPFEIVIVDNGTDDKAVLDFYATLDRSRVTVEIVEEPFNFARMCNRGARLAKGDALLFLNNDIEVENGDWLAEMVECLSFDSTGIVGAKLLYPNEKLQHAGVIVGLGEAAGHWHIEAPHDEPGPMGRLYVRQTLTAVTGACMLVTRKCFDALAGFDEDAFAIAYNDIDFCVRARNAGHRTIWTPFARLIHHESVSRGSDEEGQNNIRFEQEKARLKERHGTPTIIDDAFSPFYDRHASRPTIIVPDALPSLRPNVFR